MSKISLEKFIANTKGTQVDVSFPHTSNLKGQCVSLIQEYLRQCLEQPDKARGNAKDWINTYVAEGLGTRVNDLKKGDIIVFPNEAQGYGHIAIYIRENITYDQNNARHDNGKAGYGTIFSSDYVILRPNATLVQDVVPVQTSTGQTLVLPKTAEKWRVYDLNVKPVVGNEKGFLLPSKFGGLTYDILRYAQPDVAVIKTRDFGEVQIYVAKSTGAIIK